ncbi:hypothetical protein BN1723_013576 [Verticillium longisporum]|uniref:Uncharacterized protein n=1 Tax=Verticillium longisporum TaxID=100787 RepID=A0A0G4LU50_VERLO|nr:hypothetical protein BN1723_013576 [Verticillium longisporum]
MAFGLPALGTGHRPFPYSGNLSQAPLFVAQASSRRNDGKGWRTIVSVRGSRFLLSAAGLYASLQV